MRCWFARWCLRQQGKCDQNGEAAAALSAGKAAAIGPAESDHQKIRRAVRRADDRGQAARAAHLHASPLACLVLHLVRGGQPQRLWLGCVPIPVCLWHHSWVHKWRPGPRRPGVPAQTQWTQARRVWAIGPCSLTRLPCAAAQCVGRGPVPGRAGGEMRFSGRVDYAGRCAPGPAQSFAQPGLPQFPVLERERRQVGSEVGPAPAVL